MSDPLRRFFTSIPFVVCLLLLGCVLMAAGLGLCALKQRPELLRQTIMTQLAARLPGHALSLGRLSPELWPAPGIRAEELMLRTPDGTELLADAVSLSFHWKTLLSGTFMPDVVTLDSPYVLIRTAPAAETADAPATAQDATSGKPDDTRLFALLRELNGLTLELRNATLDLRLPDKTAHIAALNGTLTVPSGEAAGMLGLNPGRCDLRWDSLSATGFGPDLTLTAGTLHTDELRLSQGTPGLLRTGSVNFSARGAIGTALQNLDLSLIAALALTAGPPDIRGELGLSGTALCNGIPVAVGLKAPFSSRDVRISVDIRNAVLTMEDNGASLTATWLTRERTLTGKVDVQRLSLPRWFAFGRKLPAGLVTTLDDISGNFTFRLNAQSLEAPQLVFTTRGIRFTGSGGVSDFSAPVIRIDAVAGKVDLNKIFPELVDPKVSEPVYAAPPLLGNELRLPGNSADDSPIVGFDIRLKANDTTFWRFTGREFELRLSPVWESKNTLRGARVEASLKQFYQGRLTADFRAADGFQLDLSIDGAHGEALSRAMGTKTGAEVDKPPPAPFGGTLRLRAALRGQGNTLAATLAGLTGSADATLTGGFFGSGAAKDRVRFSRFTLRADALAGTPAPALKTLPAALPFTARWQAEAADLRTPDGSTLQIKADAAGPLRLNLQSGRPAAAGLPFKVTGKADGLPFSLNGKLSGTIDDNDHATLSLADVSGRMADADVAFELEGTDLRRSPRWQGKGSLAVSSLRALLSTLRIPLPSLPATALRKGELSGTLTADAKGLRLEELRGAVDDTRFSGSIHRENGDIPRWAAALKLDSLDADRYRAKGPLKDKPEPWDLRFLRKASVNAGLTVGRLILMDTIMTDCRIPITLKQGVLTVSPMTAQVADGTGDIHVRIEVPADMSADIRFQSALHNVNMRTLRRPTDKTAPSASTLAGTGNFQIDLSGLLRSVADIPGGLSGTWSAQVKDGYLQSGNSRRFFHAVTASGRMTSGVLSSDNLFVNGDNFMVRGRGSVNLVDNTVDYKLNASLPGVPDVPITYKGSLDDPHRSINALSTVAGVIGNVGKGLFNILDDVITAPLRLLP